MARDAPKRPTLIRPEIPKDVEQICLKCLEKSPVDRYGSANLLAQDLEAFLENRPVIAREPSLARRATRYILLHKWIALSLAFTGFVGILSVLILWRTVGTKDLLESEIQRIGREKETFNSRANQAESAVLDELRNSLDELTERLFGSTPDREDAEWKALDRIAQRWIRFAEQIDDTRKGQMIRAEANMRLGTIYLTLAESDKAEQKLRSSLEILDKIQPEDSDVLAMKSQSYWQLGKCWFEAGKVSDCQQAFKNAETLGLQTVQMDPESEDKKYTLSKIQRDYGIALIRTSRLKEARLQLEASIRALEEILSDKEIAKVKDRGSITEPEIERDRILEQWWSGRTANALMLKMSGESSQAVKYIEKLPSELELLKARRPEDPTVLRLQSVHHFTLGLCQLDAGQLEPFKQSLLIALGHQKQLLALYPRRQDLRKNYGSYSGTLGVVSIRLGRASEAREYVLEALRVQTELANEYRDQPEYLSEKARTLTNLVAILASVDRLEESIQYGSELIQILRGLNRDHPDQTEYAYNLAASLNILGQVFVKQGQDSQALSFFEQSREVYLDLSQRYPEVPVYCSGIANAYYSIAEIARRDQQWSKALEAYSQTVGSICSNPPRSPHNESVLLTKAYLGQAIAFDAMGDGLSRRECATLGCQAILPWKDRDLTNQQLFLRCMSMRDWPLDP